jgi:hypothetical protein
MQKRGIQWFWWGVLLLEYIYIFSVLFNYDISWMNPEKFWTHGWILENGNGLRWEDFTRAFNINVIELNPDRLSRPLSNLLEVLDTKFRASCWEVIPPHPSFSSLWLPFFIALPILLYKFFKNLGCHYSVAFAGTCLYLTSVGFLGPIVMLFHPAKSVANFLAVVSLWLISLMYKKTKDLPRDFEGAKIAGFKANYLGAIAVMFLGFFSDETGLFLYVINLIVLFPILNKAKERKMLWGIYCLIPLVYLFVLRIVLPYIHLVLRGHAVNVSQYENYPHISSLFFPDLRSLWTNLCWLFSDYPHILSHAHNVISCVPFFILQLVYVLIFIWLVYLFSRNNLLSVWGQRSFLFVGLLIAYGFFQTFQLSANVKVWGVWWYGSLFSLIYFVAFTFLLQKVFEEQAMVQKFFGLIVVIMVAESLIYTTYKLAIFKQQNLNRNNYTFTKIFNGTINPYAEFDFKDSMEKSKCKYLYTLLQWAQIKHKQIAPVDPATIESCKVKMRNNVYFPIETLYEPIELGVLKK